MHAILCEGLAHSQALLHRLELGVHVARPEQRELVRELYVQTRRQVQLLVAALESKGWNDPP